MATETLYATSLLSGTITSSSNALGSTSGTWAGDLNTNSSWTTRWAMGDPTVSGAPDGTQTVTVRARKGSNGNSPTIAINLYENGSLVGAIAAATNVTSTISQDVSGTWTGSSVTNENNVEIEVVMTAAGGSPSNRNSAQIDYIRWDGNFAAAPQVIGVGTATETDTAVGVSKIDPIRVVLGTATETDTATGITVISGTGTPPTYRSSSRSANVNQSAPYTIPVPAGTVADDITVVYLTQWNSAWTPAISGGNGTWTKFLDTSYAADSGTEYVAAWWKRATGTDSGTYSLSGWTGSQWVEAVAVTIQDIPTGVSNPIEDATLASTAGTTAFPVTEATVTDASVIVWIGDTYGADADTPPTNWTERQDGSELISLATREVSAAGTYSTSGAPGSHGTSSSSAAIIFGVTGSGGSGQNVAVTAATETDTATGLGKAKVKAVAGATETDSATGVARRKTRTLGTATETDTATGITAVLTIQEIEDFESGTDGANYTTTSGLSDGGFGTGTGQYQDTAAAEGSLGLSIDASTGNLLTRNLTLDTPPTTEGWYFLAVRGDVPTTTFTMIQIRDATTNNVSAIRLNSDGTFAVRDGNTNRGSSTHTISATTWTQVGLGFDGGSTGTVRMRLYDEAGDLIESEISGSYTQTATPFEMRFGVISDPGTSVHYDLDWVGYNHSTWVTPLVISSATVVALGTATETDTAVGVTKIDTILVALGTATETDTATGVAKTKTKAVGTTAETDTATGVSPSKLVSLGTATETDTATGVAKAKSKTIGTATETDAAVGVTKIDTILVAIGTATETDTATGVSVVLGADIVPVGTAAETDTATGLGKAKRKALGTATETGTATGLGRAKSRTVGTGTETDAATGVAKSKRVSLGNSTETDTAVGVGKIDPIQRTLGTATETDTAVGVTLVGQTIIALGTATETDTAVGVAKIDTILVSLGTATSSESAVSLARIKTLAVGTATESDAATGPGKAKVRAVGAAAETDTAVGVTLVGQQIVAIGTATETDGAAGVSKIKRVAIGVATETDAATGVTKIRAYGVGVATETDTATGVAVVTSTLVALGTATETDTAIGVGLIDTILRTLGTATETDTAVGVVPIGPIFVVLGAATETDAAGTITRIVTVYPFTPPLTRTSGGRLDPSSSYRSPTNRLLGRLTTGTHYYLIVKNGVVSRRRTPTSAELGESDYAYSSGTEYQITLEEKAILESAGYPVGSP